MALYAFDGTWNREHDQATYSRNSNVVRFAKAYRGGKAVYQKKNDDMHVVEDDDDGYIDGVGTRHGVFGKVFGGVFGAGGRTRIREALARVERKAAEGDRDVDVVGFSRGAAIALQFVNKLHKKGVRVRFLGLWDVVAAFGIPINIGPFKFNRVNLGWQLTLPPNVDHCFHAIALDERREAFRATRVQGAVEVWFRGVHSDVGGGNGNEPLNHISLAWMLRKAAALQLPIDVAAIDALQANPDADVKPARSVGRASFRPLTTEEWIHYTIKVRKHPECQNAPEGCPVETPELEKTRTRLRA